FSGSIGRPVVNDDQFDAQRNGQHPADNLVNRGTLVIRGHHDRERRIGKFHPERRAKQRYHTMKRLVILAPNWLGDAVMAMPAIADIRRAAPDAEIAVAARPSVAPMFRLVPAINEVVVLEHRASVRRVSTWRGLGAELADRKFDTALLLPNSVHAALIATGARIAERWGYRSSW